MRQINCSVCGDWIGVAYRDEMNAICGKCYIRNSIEDERKRRRDKANAAPFSDETLIDTIEDWWETFVHKCMNEIEDDVLHERIIKRLKEVLVLS